MGLVHFWSEATPRVVKPWMLRGIWKNREGQDLIEYALLAAFVAVAVAAFLPPTVAPAISTVFSKIVGFMAMV